MRKIYIKLAASVLSVLIAFSMIIGVSYAWLTLSDSPAVNGIQVSIGGGNTILLAPDITQIVTDENGNKVTVHYPGAFADTLNLSQYGTYDYLGSLAGLSPVSTADGIHWILPSYDSETGALLDVSKFQVDSTLAKANQTEAGIGSYIYLDFWVVSPGNEYDIHVATDTKSKEGSFLIELPEVIRTGEEAFALSDTTDQAASVARVGFLVNSDTGSTVGMELYSRSEEYDNRFKSLLGVYQEKGESVNEAYTNQFLIYEPNGTLHPGLEEKDGSYVVTNPLGYETESRQIIETDISSILTVQQNNTWRLLDDEMWLEDIFQASIAGKDGLTAKAAENLFYQDYLNGQVAAYVSSGDFFADTAKLYSLAAENNGSVSADTLASSVTNAGAADDVILTGLKRNTPQRIRMFIWLEGQDVDCVNTQSVSASRFSLGVELSGETK